jgi:AraC-like DNA-binding protein
LLFHDVAQANKVDSLKQVITVQTGEEKLNSYLALVLQLTYTREEGKYLALYEQEARKQNYPRHIMYALGARTQCFINHFEHDSARYFGKLASEYALANDDLNFYFTVESIIIQSYMMTGNYEMASFLANKQYKKAKELGNFTGEAEALNSMAVACMVSGQYREAFESFESALSVLKKAFPGKEYCNEYFQDIAKYLIEAAYKAKDFKSSLQWCDSLRQMIVKNDVLHKGTNKYTPPVNTGILECFYARNYLQISMLDSAMLHLDKAETILCEQETASKEDLGQFYIVTTEYYNRIHRYRLALEYADKAIASQRVGYVSDMIESMKLKAKILARMNHFEEAFRLNEKITHVSDSLAIDRFAKQMNDMRIIREVDKLETQNMLQAKQIEIQRNRLYMVTIIIILLLMALGAIFYFYSQKKAAYHGLFRQIKEQDKLSDELERMTKLYESVEVLHVKTPSIISLQNGDYQQRQLVARLNEYLLCNKNFTKSDINHNELASELATNKTYLFEAVKAVTGKTPVEYIHAMRLEEAKRMLETCPEFTVEAIAGYCGFNSRSVFYRLFRERYNFTPAEYRKIARM